jgi:hypothetical protein
MRSLSFVATCMAILIGGTGAWAQNPVFAEPQTYCRAVGTIDGPDQRYTGTGVPDWIRAAFDTPKQIADIKAGRQPDYGVAWRCVGGEVLACQNAQTPSCMRPDTDRTPTPAMSEFCRRDPGASVIPRVVTGTARMLAYAWICRGAEPSIAKATPLDAQGFVAADWKRAIPR